MPYLILCSQGDTLCYQTLKLKMQCKLQNQEEIVVVPSDGQFCNAVIMLQPGGKFRIRMALKGDILFRL
jgi:hypothetical protein